MKLRTRLFALAGLGLMAFGQSASAVNILSFGKSELNPVGTINLTASGGISTTITTAGVGGSAPITVTLYAGAVPTPFQAFLTINATSTSPAIPAGFSGVEQLYAGTVQITSAAGGGGTNYLTATFSGLNGLSGSGSGTLGGANFTLTASNLTSLTSSVLSPSQLQPPRDFSITFGELTSPLAINGATIASTNASNFGGQFNATGAPVPEPATLALVGLGIPFGLVALRRARKGS